MSPASGSSVSAREPGAVPSSVGDAVGAALAPVASFAPRRPGLYDLDGNVREWVVDCGPDCGARLALGGAWLIDDGGGAAFDADKGYNSIGIRLVRDWTGEPRHVPLATPQ